jgi:hypothetical protein
VAGACFSSTGSPIAGGSRPRRRALACGSKSGPRREYRAPEIRRAARREWRERDDRGNDRDTRDRHRRRGPRIYGAPSSRCERAPRAPRRPRIRVAGACELGGLVLVEGPSAVQVAVQDRPVVGLIDDAGKRRRARTCPDRKEAPSPRSRGTARPRPAGAPGGARGLRWCRRARATRRLWQGAERAGEEDERVLDGRDAGRRRAPRRSSGRRRDARRRSHTRGRRGRP